MSCRVLLTGNPQITQSYQSHEEKKKKGTGWALGVDIVKYYAQIDFITAHSKGKVVKTVDYLSGTNGKLDKENMGYGNYIVIKHSNNYYTLYAHLEEVYVKEGQTVQKGQKIGEMGNTGNSFGAHLHFELRLYNTTNVTAQNVNDVALFKWCNPTPYITSDLPATPTPISYIVGGVDYGNVFEGGYYLKKYTDLRQAFDNDYEKAFDHFLNYGMKEHRQGIASFNVDIYKANYKDLQQAFGDNIVKYYIHYCQYGKNEKRNGATLLKTELTPTSYSDYPANSGKSYKIRKSFNNQTDSKGSYSVWSNAYKNWLLYKDEGYHIFSNEGKQLD